jgi:hypothetical protein
LQIIVQSGSQQHILQNGSQQLALQSESQQHVIHSGGLQHVLQSGDYQHVLQSGRQQHELQSSYKVEYEDVDDEFVDPCYNLTDRQSIFGNDCLLLDIFLFTLKFDLL